MSTARFDAAHGGTLAARDLASVELWERSLARSRHRRRLAEIGRKARRRRKSVSLALSAALAAGPVLPSGLAAAESSSGIAAAGGMDAGDGLAVSTASSRVVLELGSHGALVTALQRRLNDVLPFTHLALDGIYGPVTRGAVVNFQRQHNLDATGAVDVGTWASMFNAPVVVLNAANDAGSGAGAGGSGAATRTSVSSVPASGNSLGGAATAGGAAGTATAHASGMRPRFRPRPRRACRPLPPPCRRATPARTRERRQREPERRHADGGRGAWRHVDWCGVRRRRLRRHRNQRFLGHREL